MAHLPRPDSRPDSIDGDPFLRVLSLDHRHSRLGTWLGILAALSVHAVAAVAAAAHVRTAVQTGTDGPLVAELWAEHEVDVEPPEPIAAPPLPEPAPLEEAEPTRLPSPKDNTRAPLPQASPEQPPPAAAQAAAVLTAEPDPDEPLDLTGAGFVTGTADRYAGGVTAARGTATTAVRDPNARGDGVEGGRGKRTAPVTSAPRPRSPERNLSRAARPVSTNWNCGFPSAADTPDFARVRLIVTVGTDGRPRSVAVQTDPGHGFAALAQRCAYRHRYQVGHDSSGRPATTTTPPFWVTFTR